MTKKLFSVYHYGLRIATGAHRTTPIMSLYAVSGQIPLEYRISKQLLNYTVRVLGNRNHPNHADFSQPLFQNSYQLAPRISPPCNVRSKILLQELHCKPTLIPQFSLPYPWAIPPPHINIALSQYRKAETNPNWYQITLRDILTNHENSKLIFTDGSKDATGTGAAFSSEKQKGLFKLPPESSIYSAELYAIKQALKYVLNSEHDTYCILTDSLSGIQSMADIYSRNEYMKEIHDLRRQIHDRSKHLQFVWIPSHTNITGNDTVDQLAKEATHKTTQDEQCMLRNDCKSLLQGTIHRKWLDHWTALAERKQYFLPPRPLKWTGSATLTRKEETVLNRVKMGHTRMTHDFLLQNSVQPMCEQCNVIFTVRHTDLFMLL
uniref:ribonuclease H n=1 Tax=Photinus pyralis TaxID=7054 RepID=A0A1Y1N4E3_PHOPY